jgi:molybdenum cofactor guanylyltransferase
MDKKKNILAVVMCGGESRRMGRDKGLMEINGETWVQHIANTVRSLQLPVVISINEKQQEAYGKLFGQEDLVIDSIPLPSALRGLFSVYKEYPDKDLLLLACDMVEMNATTIQHLLDEYENAEDAYEYIAYHQNDIIEPFCTIYTTKGLKKVYDQIAHHTLDKFSFQNIFLHGKTLQLEKPQQHPFKNFNSKEDLDEPEEYKA